MQECTIKKGWPRKQKDKREEKKQDCVVHLCDSTCVYLWVFICMRVLVSTCIYSTGRSTPRSSIWREIKKLLIQWNIIYNIVELFSNSYCYVKQSCQMFMTWSCWTLCRQRYYLLKFLSAAFLFLPIREGQNWGVGGQSVRECASGLLHLLYCVFKLVVAGGRHLNG